MPIGACMARSGRTSFGAIDRPRRSRVFRDLGGTGGQGATMTAPTGLGATSPGMARTLLCFGYEGRCMSLRPYTSESYSESDRPEAWRDVLQSLGLQPAIATATHAGHATAVRRSSWGVTLGRLSAGPQAVSSSLEAPAGL